MKGQEKLLINISLMWRTSRPRRLKSLWRGSKESKTKKEQESKKWGKERGPLRSKYKLTSKKTLKRQSKKSTFIWWSSSFKKRRWSSRKRNKQRSKRNNFSHFWKSITFKSHSTRRRNRSTKKSKRNRNMNSTIFSRRTKKGMNLWMFKILICMNKGTSNSKMKIEKGRRLKLISQRNSKP